MATKASVVHTRASDAAAAGQDLGLQVVAGLGTSPDALILFASPRYDFVPLLAALNEACRPVVLVGSSSSGEFTSEASGDGLACAVALRAPEMRFTASVGRDLSRDRPGAAHSVGSQFRAGSSPEFAHRSILLFADALAGHMEELIEELVVVTGGAHQIMGGGAGGDANFERRFVFYGTEAVPDAVVGLEILSHKPVGLGVGHGWQPAGDALRVTEAEGTRLVSLDAVPTADAFEEHAESTGQRFDRGNALPFFLHNVLGVDTGAGYKLRVPLSVAPDGAVACATEVPSGATVRVMNVCTADASEAAARSARAALSALEGNKPAVALFFDCVATRMRMGSEFASELDAVQEALGPTAFAGCNSIGQFARARGQFSGFHNCTAVVCVIPE